MPRWTKVFSTFLLFYWSIAAAWLLARWIEPTLPGWTMCFWIGIAIAVLALPFAWLGAQADQREQAFAVSMRATNKQLLLKTFDARWGDRSKKDSADHFAHYGGAGMSIRQIKTAVRVAINTHIATMTSVLLRLAGWLSLAYFTARIVTAYYIFMFPPGSVTATLAKLLAPWGATGVFFSALALAWAERGSKLSEWVRDPLASVVRIYRSALRPSGEPISMP